MHAGKISPQLAAIAAGIIKYIRCLVFSDALVDLAHPGIAMEQQDGRCSTALKTTGSKTVKRPVQQWAAGENGNDNDQ
jgi:hypothetical protein